MSKTDRTVQKTASLHEKAVQAVARGDVLQTPRKPRRSAPEPEHPVYMGVVHPEVMKVVKRIIANGTYTSWKANSATEVIVE